MPYCPKCGSEYADHVTTCVDCDVPLTDQPPPKRRGSDFEWDSETILVVGGSAILFVVSVGLIYLRQAALDGQLDPALAFRITQLQPSCMVLFTYVAAVVSLIVLAASVLRWLLRWR